MTEQEKKDVPEPADEPLPEEAEPQGKIVFAKGWLIACGVIFLLIIILGIWISVLPD